MGLFGVKEALQLPVACRDIVREIWKEKNNIESLEFVSGFV